MSSMNKQQFEQFIDTIKNSSESFSMEGNWVFAQFSTPNARIIYGDIFGTWKEYGVFFPKQLVPLAIVTNDGTIYYDDETLVVTHQGGKRTLKFEVEETDTFKSFSKAREEFTLQAENYFKTHLAKQIPPYVFTEKEKARLRTFARKHLCFDESVRSPFCTIADYIFSYREMFSLMCQEKTLENILQDNFKKNELREDGNLSKSYSIASEICDYVTDPTSCFESWELGLLEKVKEVYYAGGRTLTVTLVTDFDTGKTYTEKMNINEFLRNFAYNEFYQFSNKYTNEHLESVTYRGKELMGYTSSRQQEQVVKESEEENEESLFNPVMTM